MVRRRRWTRRSSCTSSSIGAGAVEGSSAAEQLGLKAIAHELAGDLIDALGAGAGPGADDASQAGALEQQADAVVQGPAAGQRALAHGREPHGQALGLAVGVDGERSLEQPQSGERLGLAA